MWGQLGHLVDFRDSQESQERICKRNRGQGVGESGSGGAGEKARCGLFHFAPAWFGLGC